MVPEQSSEGCLELRQWPKFVRSGSEYHNRCLERAMNTHENPDGASAWVKTLNPKSYTNGSPCTLKNGLLIPVTDTR